MRRIGIAAAALAGTAGWAVLALNRGDKIFREDERQVPVRIGDTLVLHGFWRDLTQAAEVGTLDVLRPALEVRQRLDDQHLRAQDRLLEKDGARAFFSATIYSMDVGHAKPRPEIFATAVETLGISAGEILHIGDSERTDVKGALAAGFRAVRLDVVRAGGPSEAEFVARSFGELTDYLVGQVGRELP